jgi:uncharacterized membrane protein YqjE
MQATGLMAVLSILLIALGVMALLIILAYTVWGGEQPEE